METEPGEGLGMDPKGKLSVEPEEKLSKKKEERPSEELKKTVEHGKGLGGDAGEELAIYPEDKLGGEPDGLNVETDAGSEATHQDGGASPMQQSPDQSNCNDTNRCAEDGDENDRECGDMSMDTDEAGTNQDNVDGHSDRHMEHDPEGADHMSEGETGDDIKEVTSETEISSGGSEDLDNTNKTNDSDDRNDENEEASSECMENNDEEVTSFNDKQKNVQDLVSSSSDKHGCDDENNEPGTIAKIQANDPCEISESKIDYDTEIGDIEKSNKLTDRSEQFLPANNTIDCSNSNDTKETVRTQVTEGSESVSSEPVIDDTKDDSRDLDSAIQSVEAAPGEVESSDGVADFSDSDLIPESVVQNDKPAEGVKEAAAEPDVPVTAESTEPDAVSSPVSVSNEDKEKVRKASAPDDDEGELSETSLEEVSEDEEEDVDKERMAAESGIEEVSDEEGEYMREEAKNISGVEEVSEEEEDQEQDDSITAGKEGQTVSGDRKEKPDTTEVSEDDIQEAGSGEMSEGELEADRKAGPESGMEEVSEEEEDSEEEEGEEEKEEGEEAESEGMENVSSEEEEEEERNEEKEEKEDVEMDKESREKKVLDARTVELKQNGEVVKIDDTGKESTEIVKEILEDLTIKVETASRVDRRNSENAKETSVKSDREKSRKRKDRRESAKYKTNSSAVKSDKKDMRDINERLKAQASYGEDIELDYDDVHEETKEKAASDSDALSSSESDEGELSEEEDCEEGEIREPGQKPFIKPTCRFFMRGHCTWGVNCRFLHPGVNDKGYYQLIERPGFNNKPPPPFEDQHEEEERSPSPEPPPKPPSEPKEETAWERGLRQAKELRKKALERREHETNFEHKKLNLSIEENPECNKENTIEEERPPAKKKTVYYEKEVFSDDEYYDQTPVRQQQKQQLEQAWFPGGQYENFEVRWSREPGYYPPPQHSNYPPAPQAPPTAPGSRYSSYSEQSFRGREGRFPQRRPSPKQYSPSPPPNYQSNQRYSRPQRDPRMEPPPRREKVRERPGSPPLPPPKGIPQNASKPKADDWHDPWRRSNANKPKSPSRKRSRSRGRRRSKRSHSYSSSYSSSSYSGSSRSRSRSSSFSSVSSRSRSRSRSSSASSKISRSPAPRRNPSADRRRPPPQTAFPGNRRMPPHDHQRGGPDHQRGGPDHQRGGPSAFRGGGGRGRGGRSPDKRPGMNQLHLSPTKGMMKGPQAYPLRGGPPAQGRPQMMDSRGGMPPGRAPVPKIAEVGRKMDRNNQQQRRFHMDVKARERQLPPSALSKDKRPPGRRPSATRSRSRSRSSSSSRSSRSSSYSSSGSRSSSSSSSGSADSDHLYRNIGGAKDSQRQGAGPGPGQGPQRNRPTDKSRSNRHSQDGRQKMPPKPDSKTMVIREGEFGKPMSALPQKPKDPLKVTGQKSNIKLTLIKPGDKSASGGGGPDQMVKKRPADHDSGGPPAKRPSLATQSKTDKPMKKPEKPSPVSPTKMPQSPMKAAASAVGVAPAAPPAPAVKRKSTVNRREELLNQLKAVEDAIAKKKKKMT